MTDTPNSVVELGPGDSLGIGLMAILTGSERYIAIDAVRHASPGTNLAVFNELVNLLKSRAPIPVDNECAAIRPELNDYNFPHALFDDASLALSLAPARLEKLKQLLLSAGEGGAIQYFAPFGGMSTIKPESIDWIFSQAVLEHLDNLNETYQHCYRVLKPKGVMTHQIDYQCHETAPEWNGHWKYPRWLWALMRGRRPWFVNRLPHSSHLQMQQQAGFDVCVEMLQAQASGITRSQLAKEFKFLSDQDMNIAGAFFVSMKPPSKMNKKLKEALDYCEQSGIRQAVFAVPFQLSTRDALALKSVSVCKGMVLHCPSPELTATSSSQWLGCFVPPGGWQLPTAKGTLIFVGSQLMLTRSMALSALRSGRLSIICKLNGKFQPLKLYRFLIWRAGEKLHRHIRQLPHENLMRKSLYGLASIPLIKSLWTHAVKRGPSSVRGEGSSGLSGEALYLELFRRSLEQPAHNKINPIPNRVLLVNAGLAAGGAERQIVNTLIGLRDSGRCESVALLAEYIDHAPRLDFFLHELEDQGIEVAQVQHAVTLADDGLSSLPPMLAELAADLPGGILEEILNLVEEFRARRPSVVHAWQDSTSIKAGIAAVIAGVPRIVLASRNITPMNFSYYQDYMYSAYRALASLESVAFSNNSEAGALDYTNWLGLPIERFTVVRNGVDLSELKRADEDIVRNYRQSLGIPADAHVVGSIFRFWAEKRPMLWLQSAAALAETHPDLHFLIIGEGPMRQEMEAFIAKHKLTGKVHLPGARPDIAIPLSAMDIFVLTSEFEGTPNVVLEAQWLGLPVVVTDAGGARESFDRDASGMLATPSSVNEITRLVGLYLESDELRTQAKLAGPKFVERVFGVKRMVNETLALYWGGRLG
jgi:glycosyltransferase involved in cell wall biosynthesis/SAM-dependent methyltransferase